MAVYTEVPDEELNRFVADYDIGTAVSFKGIAEGVENSNFLLKTTEGVFVLTLYERRVDPADLPFFIGLLEHLAARGVTCPQPLRDRGGNVLKTLCRRPAALMTFLEGVWVRRPTVEHCQALGGALASLHEAAADYDGRRANALSVDGWRPIFAAVADRADSVAPGLSAEMETEISFLETHWPQDLPGGIIHADLFPDNVFFLGNTISGLIDFYFACRDMLAYDLAICLNAWCFEPDMSFNLTKGRALMNAYARRRPLGEAEIAALPILARGAAMRFFVTRLYDLVNHPPGAFVRPKDPMEYAKRIRFHRSVTNAREYGLGL
ncbi:homoserine kinase [Lutibaculum baratangense]|uniref:Homoserine kinase n=1 Tax=Lutibaculum baratangense AMV1 TaxID=631454 RepID=V4TK13_9HYPH|nr:homoserine kinase [Lutibaculum baratangense]ESR26233.1 Homoserine kinase [Lutibaculum baratangense AMV1]